MSDLPESLSFLDGITEQVTTAVHLAKILSKA